MAPRRSRIASSSAWPTGGGAGRTGAPAQVGGLIVDPKTHTARVDGKQLALTPTEFRLLAALSTRAGEVVDRRTLLRSAWPDERDPDPECSRHTSRVFGRSSRRRARRYQ